MRDLLIIPFLLFIFLDSSASDLNEKLTTAEKFYNEQKFDTAAKIYTAVIDEGVITPSVFYNAGNSYYNNENYPLALYYYLLAKKHSPEDESINNNIKLTRSKLDPSAEGTDLVSISWIDSMVHKKSPTYWIWATIIFLNAGFLGLFLLRTGFLKEIKSFANITSFVFIICGVSSFFLVNYAENNQSYNKTGLIIENSEVFGAPSVTGSILKTVPAGSIFIIEDKNEKWVMITNNDFKGWVKKEKIKLF